MQLPSKFSFLRQGKVRDLYGLDDGRHLLIVASDRISAFDHVLPNLIPEKGDQLTRLSNFWFEQTSDLVATWCRCDGTSSHLSPHCQRR